MSTDSITTNEGANMMFRIGRSVAVILLPALALALLIVAVSRASVPVGGCTLSVYRPSLSGKTVSGKANVRCPVKHHLLLELCFEVNYSRHGGKWLKDQRFCDYRLRHATVLGSLIFATVHRPYVPFRVRCAAWAHIDRTTRAATHSRALALNG